RRAQHQGHRDDDEDAEHDHVEQRAAHFLAGHQLTDGDQPLHQATSPSSSRRMASARGSISRFANRMYRNVMRKVVTNCPRPMIRPQVMLPNAMVPMNPVA